MFDIAAYLERFKKLSQSRGALRAAVREAVREVCGIEIEEECIDVRGSIARIHERPAVRNEIFMKKAAVLGRIREQTNGVIADIA